MEGMSAEVISLRLEKVGWEIFGAIAVVEAQCGRESWSRNTPQGAFADDISPSCLRLVNGLVEEVVKEQILEVGICTICLGDVLQKHGTDDTASTPHKGNRGFVELPAVVFGSLSHSVSGSLSLS